MRMAMENALEAQACRYGYSIWMELLPLILAAAKYDLLSEIQGDIVPFSSPPLLNFRDCWNWPIAMIAAALIVLMLHLPGASSPMRTFLTLVPALLGTAAWFKGQSDAEALSDERLRRPSQS